MKLDRSEAWWLARADREGDAEVGAGAPAPAGAVHASPAERAPVPRLVRHVARPPHTSDLGATARPHVTAADVRGERRRPDTGASSGGVSPVDDTRIAFGRFVEFMRRQRALTIEQLAERADLDVGELVSIEDDLHYTPEPRTVYQLARTFNIPQQRLLQLAGLATAGDTRLRQEAVRFAARSESVQKLSREERAALEEFVTALSRQDG